MGAFSSLPSLLMLLGITTVLVSSFLRSGTLGWITGGTLVVAGYLWSTWGKDPEAISAASYAALETALKSIPDSDPGEVRQVFEERGKDAAVARLVALTGYTLARAEAVVMHLIKEPRR